jgi:hypothetical protein
MKKSTQIDKTVEKLANQALDVLELPGFKKDVLSLRGKFGIPEHGYKSSSETLVLENMVDDSLLLASEVSKILNRYSLTEFWREAVTRYVVINELRGWFISPMVGYETNSDGDIICLNIKIQKDTTIDDIEALWSLVEILQKDMPGRFSKGYTAPAEENRVRVAEIKRLIAEGKSHKEIGEELGLGYSDVSNIIRNEKNRLHGKT